MAKRVSMPRSAATRYDRLKLRATKEKKRLLAATYERIVLSERDVVRVLALLENPPKPTAALLAAARASREQTGE
jgi:uncharacterized protein (DUF1778 family)